MKADVEYVARFDSTVNKYLVAFKNHDGSELQTDSVAYGEVPAYAGETPVKAATAQYTYTFKGWSPAIDTVKADAEYVAQFDSTVNEYRIVFKNHNGVVLASDSVAYGEVPVYAGAEPEKSANPQYSYTFAGWDPAIDTVKADAEYVAQFDSTANKVLVAFKNHDGAVLQSDSLAYGQMPAYAGETPTKAATAQYSYAFKGWSPAIVAATADAEYVAQFDSTANKVLVVFRNYDGSMLQGGAVSYGQMPVYAGAEPVKPAAGKYAYTFKGWSPKVVAATADAEYVAQFDSTVRAYVVVFYNIDGTELQRTTEVHGTVPVYEGPEPVRKGWQGKVFVFKGWDREIVAATGDAEYIAQYDEVSAVSPSFAVRPSVSVRGRALLVSGVRSGTTVAVYDMRGRVVARETTSGPDHRLELEDAGLYVVRVGNASFRLNVR